MTLPVQQAPLSAPTKVTAVTAGTASANAVAARQRGYLAIINQSATATISFAFGSSAAVTNGAGSVTLVAEARMEWSGDFVPSDAINVIASAASTPVTILEGGGNLGN